MENQGLRRLRIFILKFILFNFFLDTEICLIFIKTLYFFLVINQERRYKEKNGCDKTCKFISLRVLR